MTHFQTDPFSSWPIAERLPGKLPCLLGFLRLDFHMLDFEVYQQYLSWWRCVNCICCMIPFNSNHNPMELDVISPILQMRKLKLGVVKRLALVLQLVELNSPEPRHALVLVKQFPARLPVNSQIFSFSSHGLFQIHD